MNTKFQTLDELSGLIKELDRAELRPIQIMPSEASKEQTKVHNAPNYAAIWNINKDHSEAIVERKNSALVQHEDAFKSFVRVAEKLDLSVSGTLKNHGGEVVIETLFGNRKIEDGSKEGITLGVRLENNYDKRGYPNFTVEPFGLNHACSNGMMLGKTIGSVFQKHRKVADLDKALHEYIGKVLETIAKEVEGQIKDAQKETFKDDEDLREVLIGELHSKVIAKRVKQILGKEKKLTRYTLYNSITNYATFDARDEKQRVAVQRIAQRVLMNDIKHLNRGAWD